MEHPKTKTVQVRMTVAQYADLQRQARAAGMTVSAWVREAALAWRRERA